MEEKGVVGYNRELPLMVKLRFYYEMVNDNVVNDNKNKRENKCETFGIFYGFEGGIYFFFFFFFFLTIIKDCKVGNWCVVKSVKGEIWSGNLENYLFSFEGGYEELLLFWC